MRIRKLSLILFVILFLFPDGNKAMAQDPVFSQFFASPIYLNPAFSGSSRCSRIAFNFQNKRYDLDDFTTLNFSFDTYVDALEGGLSFMATSDHPAEFLMRNSFSAAYAYHLQATRDFNINFGIQASYIRNDVTWGKLEFADPNEPPPDVTWAHGVDFATGMLVFNEVFYGGVAAHHITRPNMSLLDDVDARLNVKYTAHIGAHLEPHLWRRYRRPVDYFLSPNIVFQTQGPQTHLSYGIYGGIEPIMVGTWFRHWLDTPFEKNNSLIFLVGLNLDNYRVGYSYDYSFSGYSDLMHGTHEISVTIKFNCQTRDYNRRLINCPGF